MYDTFSPCSGNKFGFIFSEILFYFQTWQKLSPPAAKTDSV